VFRIRLREQSLTLVVEPETNELLDGPDNICVSPRGDLVICEDRSGDRANYLIGVTPQGRCYRIARNAHPMNGEFAGACFSADGETLFVNVQRPGMTFAIWGPWGTRRA
jgi:secreted PhoX family phosphatase